jgi:DNA primase
MISKETIALVRERTNLVEIVSESVPLKRRGRRYVGLCPFHQEKTPSFNVNPDINHFHCFGCHEKGDAIAFLQLTEGYDFVEAVRALAERAGIPIEDERAKDGDAERKKREVDALLGALHIAATWYEEQLRTHKHRSYAIDELARRGLSPEDPAVQAFRVGYAPPEWDGLAAFLRKQGVSPVLGEAAGLIVPRSSGSGYYDRFRHRLMFSIMDPRKGRVIAFSGRALPALPEPPGQGDSSREPPPKYMNSPECAVYQKKANLFGLWQARNDIRREERVILVEGNFDVVSLHARGIANVVAPLGTAFTEEQATLIRRHYAGAATLLFDGDAAGRKATRMSEKPCEVAGLDANVATLPDRVDPDELVRT